MAITASTLTTVCIFFPILFVKGVTKIFFAEFAIVVVILMFASLFSALTLTPMLSSVLMPAEEKRKQSRFFNKTEQMFNALSCWYLANTVMDIDTPNLAFCLSNILFH